MSGEHFAATYAESRAKFLAAAEAAGLHSEAHAHPLPGSEGEPLAMDVARQGPLDADRLLIISSGCHGVEGFAGSGIQTGLLRDASWRAAVQASGVAVLYIHALNPHGFSWLRRVTHEGADLNRNFLDFTQPLPRNAGYDEIANALIPRQWPPAPEDEAALRRYAEQHGERGLQTAITSGQHAHPQGLFYSGVAPSWSHQTLRGVLEQHGRHARRIGWIDLHTGLGPRGHGERIFACRNEAAALARARAWWGDEVTSIYDGSSSSAPLQGLMWNVIFETCPAAEYTGIALEYGTCPVNEMVAALRADHWLARHPEAPATQAAAIKRQMLDAFYVDTPEWKQQLLTQAREASQQALAGLAVA